MGMEVPTNVFQLGEGRVTKWACPFIYIQVSKVYQCQPVAIQHILRISSCPEFVPSLAFQGIVASATHHTLGQAHGYHVGFYLQNSSLSPSAAASLSIQILLHCFMFSRTNLLRWRSC